MESIVQEIQQAVETDLRGRGECKITLDDGHITLRGIVPSYYGKQIFQQAVMKILRKHAMVVGLKNELTVLYK